MKFFEGTKLNKRKVIKEVGKLASQKKSLSDLLKEISGEAKNFDTKELIERIGKLAYSRKNFGDLMDELTKEKRVKMSQKEMIRLAVVKLLDRYKKVDKLKYLVVKREFMGKYFLDDVVVILRKKAEYKFIKKNEIEKKWNEFMSVLEMELASNKRM